MWIGIVLAYPWNDGKVCWPSFTRTSWPDNKEMRKVALSFNSFAIVFDIYWWVHWQKSNEKCK